VSRYFEEDRLARAGVAEATSPPAAQYRPSTVAAELDVDDPVAVAPALGAVPGAG
jgi:hypothetical protein